MSPPSEIPVDAVVIRHIPGGSQYQQPPTRRITSQNFQLRPDEIGVSVTLSLPATLRKDGQATLARLKSTVDSRLAFATVAAIRQIGFEIKRAPINGNPEHALIVSGLRKLDVHIDRKHLATKFQYFEVDQIHRS